MRFGLGIHVAPDAFVRGARFARAADECVRRYVIVFFKGAAANVTKDATLGWGTLSFNVRFFPLLHYFFFGTNISASVRPHFWAIW